MSRRHTPTPTTHTTAPPKPCARGCTTRGHHNPTCPGDDCPGCTPRPAEFGTLCAWDWVRFNGDIVDLPFLLAHLRDIGQPHAGQQGLDRPRSGGRPSDRTLIPAPWLDADEIAGVIANWCDEITTKHPARLTGPPPTRWATGGTYRDPDTGSPIYTPPRILETDPEATARWLIPLLPWVAQQDWAATMREDLARIIGTTRARWPMAERGHAVEHIPCPRCDQLTLWYDPPTTVRRTMQVTCTNEDCGRIFTEDEWERLRALVTLDARKAAS